MKQSGIGKSVNRAALNWSVLLLLVFELGVPDRLAELWTGTVAPFIHDPVTPEIVELRSMIPMKWF
jgi:hypothetical protein